MKKFLKHIALYMATLLLLAIPMPALAAGSAGVSVSSSSVTVGNTVKVTFSFNGGGTYIAGVKAYVSYDASLLKYSGASGDGDANVAGGSGTVVLETSSTSKSALSITMTFQATAAGSAKVSITGSDMVDWDGNTIGSPTAGKTITIKEKEAEKPSEGSDKEPEKDKDPQKPEESQISEVVQPTDLEMAMEVQVNGDTLYLWKSLQNVNLPEGFTVKTIVYNGEQVQAASREDLDMTLLYFTNSEGANGKFFVYNGYDVFYVYQLLTIGANTYIPMLPGEEVIFPEGYEKGEQLIEEEAVFAWIHGADSEYCYLYLLNQSTGKAGIYLYDRQENTLQRVNQQMYALLLESEKPQEDVPVITQPEPEQTEKGVLDRILEDDDIMMVVIGILGGSLLLVAVMGSILIASRKKAKMQAETMEISEEVEEPTESAEKIGETEEIEENPVTQQESEPVQPQEKAE